MDKLDFVLGICAYGDITDGTFKCLENLYDTDYYFKTITRSQDALIGRSRCIVCQHFLENDVSDILIFLDTDIVFMPDDIKKLTDAVKDGYDVVAGGYMLGSGKALALKTWEDHVDPDGEIYEVEYISTGFMAITRNALVTIRDTLNLPLLQGDNDRKCYPFFESGRDWSGRHQYYISEDWDFCDKARKAGFKVYWHSGVLLGHLKRICMQPKALLENIRKPN